MEQVCSEEDVPPHLNTELVNALLYYDYIYIYIYIYIYTFCRILILCCICLIAWNVYRLVFFFFNSKEHEELSVTKNPKK